MLRVDPAQLEAYATQLDRNARMMIDPLRVYCVRTCGDTAGLTGLLRAARPSVSAAFHTSTRLFDSAERNLAALAAGLRAAAAQYRAGDMDAAERVWLNAPHLHPPVHWSALESRSHIGDYRDPFTPQPRPPGPDDSLITAIAQARAELEGLDSVLRRVGIRVPEDLFLALTGDWTILRRNAAGFATLAAHEGVGSIAANLAYGLDSLSTTWDGPAATAFDYQIRQRWHHALNTLTHLFQDFQETFEWIAQCAENAFVGCAVEVRLCRSWFLDKTLLAARLAMSPRALWVSAIVAEMAAELATLAHRVRLLLDTVRRGFVAFIEFIEKLAADARVIEDLWLAPGENRLRPITAG